MRRKSGGCSASWPGIYRDPADQRLRALQQARSLDDMLQAVASFPYMAQASSSIGFKEDAAQLAPECPMALKQGQVWLGRMAYEQKGE